MTSGLSFREGNPSALPVNKYVVTPLLDVHPKQHHENQCIT